MEDIEDLAKRLVLHLESETGKAVELVARTDGVMSNSELKCFYPLRERHLKVTRVPDLPEEYVHDVSLLEKEYTRLHELRWKWLMDYDAMQSPFPNGKAAFEAVRQTLGAEVISLSEYSSLERHDGFVPPEKIAELSSNKGRVMIESNLRENIDERLCSMNEVEKILQEKGILYLQHILVVDSSGIYEIDCNGINTRKLAEIIYSPLKDSP